MSTRAVESDCARASSPRPSSVMRWAKKELCCCVTASLRLAATASVCTSILLSTRDAGTLHHTGAAENQPFPFRHEDLINHHSMNTVVCAAPAKPLFLQAA